MFCEAKFRGKIAETRNTISSVARKMGIDASTLYRKMTGESDFTRSEIQSITQILSLTADDVQNIFFAQELA